MATRILVLTSCLLVASAYIAKASKTEPTFIRASLSGLPLQVDKWRGREVPIDDKVVSVLGVDEYLNREYFSNGRSLGLYVGFYQTQRQGNTIHSPLNCLPGAGWDPVKRSYMTIPSVSDGSRVYPAMQVNRITIEKGLDRAVVLYWYQAHGRIVANEYWGRIFTVVDAMRLNRTDGAMVRVVSSFGASNDHTETVAENDAINFVTSIFPLLSRYLPE